jgi:hypothetical protein
MNKERNSFEVKILSEKRKKELEKCVKFAE